MDQLFLTNNFWILVLIVIWTLPWKGVALWRASKRGDKWWFIIMLVVNTIAILEITYIFYFSERKSESTPQQPA